MATEKMLMEGVLRGGDRQHLHYLLLDYGLSARQALIVLSVFALIGGTVGLLSYLAGTPDYQVFASFVLVGVAYFFGVRHLSRSVSCADAANLISPSA